MHFQPNDLEDVANVTMPFGKFKGTRIHRLPEAYLIWFSERGFPTGKLGELMNLALTLQTQGLEHLILPLERPSRRKDRS
ncbi:MAG: DUF3820 family protein [Pseudomonadales bacterium]|jgi:uncharacterized protein (DUF3820 family)|tara:strand:- start:453 stop:692 length:240 start_codon:yes stop_codon:yes gene_type:complete